MVFSKSSGKNVKFNITQSRLRTLIISILLSFIILIFGIYISYNTNLKEAAYKQLKRENKMQEQQLINLSNQLMIVEDQMTKLIEREEELDSLLGEQGSKKLKKKNKKLTLFQQDIQEFKNENLPNSENLSSKMNFLISYLKDMNVTYDTFVEKVHQMKTKYAATPSMRPLYGKMMSSFGWRRHPLYGKQKHHKGIDIASWAGAPIQVTADGIVEYAGYSTSYGYLVVVDHGYGLKTIYAHCSQLLVEKRDIVKKGQIIAQVGSTGLSTGNHLHYEIKKRRQSINPVTYLDLDMFTARDRVW